MKIVIAPDSFKGSMSSMQASNAINRAILEIAPTFETVLLPMADGGEGTVEAILWARGGKRIYCRVFDPIGRKINAMYGWIDQEKTAVIETAAASGLPLLKNEDMDPEKASSYGTGQLIKDALERGAETIILGLGGSATIDAGTGLFQALGLKLFDNEEKELANIGGRLERISRIDVSSLEPALKTTKIIVASDVTNSLLGREGAIAIFGPQKGVKEDHLIEYEEKMCQFAKLVTHTTGKDKSMEPGSGAAGGIGFLLQTFLDLQFLNGLDLIVDMVQFEKQLPETDLVLTGEGRIDGQSLYGKVPVGIGHVAKKYNVPVIAFAGSIGTEVENLEQYGINAVFPISNGPITLDQALANAELLLYEATKRLIKILETGSMIRKAVGKKDRK